VEYQADHEVARFEQTFTGPASPVRARIWQRVYGPEYAASADPFSYVSVTELRRFADELHAAPGQCLVDAGCGRGGPGLWVAAVTGARLIGIDLDRAALAAARHRAAQTGMAGRASFRPGGFSDTGLPDSSAQAVMSIDALLFAPSKPAAAAELARILVPGGRLVLTSWDYHSQPAGRPAQVADHRPLLDQAGFDVLGYEETPAWRDRQQRTGQALLAAAAELAAESGSTTTQQRARITEMNANLAAILRRVLVIAARRRPAILARQPGRDTPICPD
jgi:cyclopropane fatty-acyl-phospholipid synthase-like methyltransferase